MKLSREDLHFALLSACFNCTAEALDNNTLEIDGYEQPKWVKLDPNDESTYPQRLTRVLVCDKNKNVFESFVLIHNGIREFVGNNVTHWRPLPKPPAETAEMSDELFPTPPPRKEKCRKCKHWAMAKNPWGYEFSVCTIRSTKRNQFGFELKSANSAACHLYKPEEQK